MNRLGQDLLSNIVRVRNEESENAEIRDKSN